MAPRRTNRRPRRQRRRRRTTARMYDEYFTFSLQVGLTAQVTVANLSQRPTRSVFRPIFMTVTASGGLVPSTASDSRPGFYAPAALQLALRNPTGERVAVSRPRMSGPIPSSLTVRYPRSGDWYPENNASTDVIADIDAICLGSNSLGQTSPSYITGLVHIRVLLGPELVGTSCPTLNTVPNTSSALLQQLSAQ